MALNPANKPLTILADANIPALDTLFATGVRLVRYQHRQPPAAALADAQILLVRSVTQVNAALLAQAPQLQFVGTATIGTEHIDIAALQQRGIAFASAPGANAASVGNYVLSAVVEMLCQAGQTELPQGTAVMIGAGHTGKAAGMRLAGLGYQVSYYDPPLCANPNGAQDSQLDIHDDWTRVLNADLVSCHVPLTTGGAFPTHHLFDGEGLAALKADALLINASRGAVIAAQDLRRHLQQQRRPVCLDVWEHEPQLCPDLVSQVVLATPHIAGHSLEGKVGGAWRLYQGLCQAYDWEVTQSLECLLPEAELPVVTLNEPPSLQRLATLLRGIYDIRDDDARLRDSDLSPETFDRLRKTYPLRRELSVQRVRGTLTTDAHWQQRLQQLGFSVVS